MKGFCAIAVRAFLLLLSLAAVEACAGNYDPLAVDPAFHPAHVDLTVHDAARNRDIPVRVYLPTNTAPMPVILFSHGLDGSRSGSVFLGEN
jgi:predicted dienelactone hydrolase